MSNKEIVPVFVIGCPRSGTTLVGSLLGSHPMALNAGESQLFFLTRSGGEVEQGLFLPARIRELAGLTPEVLRDLIISRTREAGKWVYVDHSPWHALCLADIKCVFPNAFIIHVVRHPAAVARSLARSFQAGYQWAGAGPEDRLQLWAEFVLAVQPWREDPCFCEVRYEDLCASPVETSQALFQSLRLSWEDHVLHAFTILHAGSTSSREPLAYRDTDGQLRFRVFEEPLCLEEELENIRSQFAPLLEMYGYG